VARRPRPRDADGGAVFARAPGARAALDRLVAAAPGARAALIRGEAGSGRSFWAGLFAQLAGGGPMVVADCALLPPDLFEAILFGVAPGAATGVEARPGLVARAGGGTLVLDRIELLDAGLQAKLLRLLDDGEYAPLGGALRRAGCRFAVTLTDPPGAEAGGVPAGLRPDLYYRLSALVLRLPPLRERREDLPAFARLLLNRIDPRAELSPAVMLACQARDWPGNLRELGALLAGAAARAAGQRIDLRHLPESIHAPGGSGAPAPAPAPADPAAPPPTLAEVERRHVLEVLAGCAGNRSQAARLLGISRKSLWERLRRWEAQGDGRAD